MKRLTGMRRGAALLLMLSVNTAIQAAEQTVDALLTKASNGLTQFTFDWPQPLFAEALKLSTSGSDEWAHAAFGLATCKLYINPVSEAGVTEAGVLFTQILAQAPTSRFAPNACLALGRIAEQPDFYGDLPQLSVARQRYQEIMTTWPSLPLAGEAAFRLAGTYATTNTPDDARLAISTLQEWLTAHPQDPLASAMWQFMGDTTFLRLVDRPGSLPLYLKADELGLTSPTKAWKVYWRIAQTAEFLTHNKPLAITYYTKICTTSQTSGKAFEAQVALARLGAPVPELSAFAAYQGPRPALPKPQAPLPQAAVEVKP